MKDGVAQALQIGDMNQLFSAFYVHMLGTVKLRGFLAPGGHIAWAAVEGFAIVLAMKGMKFTWEVMFRSEFLKIVWIPIALHAFWDSSLFRQTKLMNNCKNAFLIGVIWVILLVFFNRGLQQISECKEKIQEE